MPIHIHTWSVMLRFQGVLLPLLQYFPDVSPPSNNGTYIWKSREITIFFFFSLFYGIELFFPLFNTHVAGGPATSVGCGRVASSGILMLSVWEFTVGVWRVLTVGLDWGRGGQVIWLEGMAGVYLLPQLGKLKLPELGPVLSESTRTWHGSLVCLNWYSWFWDMRWIEEVEGTKKKDMLEQN